MFRTTVAVEAVSALVVVLAYLIAAVVKDDAVETVELAEIAVPVETVVLRKAAAGSAFVGAKNPSAAAASVVENFIVKE